MTRDGGDTSHVLGAPRLLADVVERDRLTRRLDERAPFTVIRGPGGSGKTVLVANWVRRERVSGVWGTIDSATSTRERLWMAVAERLVGTSPAPVNTGGFLDSVGAAGDLRALLRRSLGMLDLPRYLVLDNFHALQDANAVAEDLVDLLLSFSQLNAIVLTRAPTLLARPSVGRDRLRVPRHRPVPGDRGAPSPGAPAGPRRCAPP